MDSSGTCKIEAGSAPGVIQDAIARELSRSLSGDYSEYTDPDTFVEELYEGTCDIHTTLGVGEPANLSEAYEVLADNEDILPNEGGA